MSNRVKEVRFGIIKAAFLGFFVISHEARDLFIFFVHTLERIKKSFLDRFSHANLLDQDIFAFNTFLIFGKTYFSRVISS